MCTIIKRETLQLVSLFFLTAALLNAQEKSADEQQDDESPANPPGDTLKVMSIIGRTKNIFPIVVNPALITDHTYEITFFENAALDRLLWRLMDQTTATMKLDNMELATDTSASHPAVDGVEWQVFAGLPNFADFLTVANAAGPLNPPEYAAFAFNASGFPHPTTGDRPTDRQQVGLGLWGIHTADNGIRASYEAFLARTTRNGLSWREIIPHDFEMRFTGPSYAWNAFTSGNFMQVPFELWNIGNGTPDDPSDDYRMVPWLIDDDDDSTFNMGAPNTKTQGNYDHSISGGENDPFTDWIYWNKPQDTTPGEAGYRAAEVEMIAGTYSGSRETEVMARMVLVNFNGDLGATPPSGVYNQNLPENGTIFRIITDKPNLPGDRLRVISPSPVSVADGRAPASFFLRQNYPNPFKPETYVFFGLARDAAVRFDVFNILGQRVITLVDQKLLSGQHVVVWNGKNAGGNRVAAGIYLYRLEAGDFIKIRKMILTGL